MKQQALAEFAKYGKATRLAQFLREMDHLVLWKKLGEAIEPIYPDGTSLAGGRPGVQLERMLRIYFLKLWFNLSDPAAKEALHDSAFTVLAVTADACVFGWLNDVCLAAG